MAYLVVYNNSVMRIVIPPAIVPKAAKIVGKGDMETLYDAMKKFCHRGDDLIYVCRGYNDNADKAIETLKTQVETFIKHRKEGGY